MTIKKKLLINTLITISILFTTTFSILGLTYYRMSKEAKMDELISLSTSKANEISLWFQEAINEFSLMASLPSFKSLDVREIDPIITSISTNNDKLNNIGVSTIDGKSLLDNTDLKYIDHSTYNILINEDQPYVIQVPSTSYPFFIICCPIYNYANDKVGFIYGTIANNDILTILNELKIPSSITWLIDDQYQIISHNANYFANRYLSASQLADAIENNKVSLEDNRGNNVFFTHNTIANTNGIKLCTLIPQSIIMKDLYILLAILILLWIATVVLVFLIINDTTNKITKPIDSFIKTCKKGKRTYVLKNFLNYRYFLPIIINC